jgi:hypothetical protein
MFHMWRRHARAGCGQLYLVAAYTEKTLPASTVKLRAIGDDSAIPIAVAAVQCKITHAYSPFFVN